MNKIEAFFNEKIKANYQVLEGLLKGKFYKFVEFKS